MVDISKGKYSKGVRCRLKETRLRSRLTPQQAIPPRQWAYRNRQGASKSQNQYSKVSAFKEDGVPFFSC